MHLGKYDRDFHERGTGYFYSGIVSSVVRHSHELCHGSRLQDIINSKTNNMKKNFVKSRWLFTMLLFVTTMIMPTMMLAKSITPTKPNGEGTAEKPYQIGTAAELYWFAGLVNGTLVDVEKNASAYAILTTDITVNKGVLDAIKDRVSGNDFIEWIPVGSAKNAYTGTFDGKGYTISGLYFDHPDADYYVGLFGCIGHDGKGKISNVGVLDSYFQFGAQGGGVCGVNNGELQKCSNSSTVIGNERSEAIGGVCGKNSGTVRDCKNTGSVSGQEFVGGVCGFNKDSGIIENCFNKGTVSGTDGDVGGVCGFNYKGTIKSCYNTASVSGTGDDVGGVCGENSGATTNCFNKGTVSGTGKKVGGVCGNSSGTIKSCYNTASVSGQASVGGVCGVNYEGTTNCFNKGSVSGTGDNVGGVCGDNISGTIKSCYNTASVSGDDYVGGVCGENSGVTTNCFNKGIVSGSSQFTSGGVCGYDISNISKIINCYYLSGTAKRGIEDKEDVSGKAEKKSIEQFESGEVAWLLNGSKSVPTEGSTLAWYQKLGENADAYPVLKSTGDNTVYKASLFSCDGTTIGEYANKPEGDKLSHNYQMAETADEGTSNLYGEECAICHTVKDGTKYIKDFCGIKDNNIKLTVEPDGSYKAAEPVDINGDAAYDSPVDFTAPTLNYTRTYLGADLWQAVYVPFETQATDWTDNGITVASINNFHEYEKKDGSYETVLEVKKATSGAFEANTPYLLRTKDSGSKTITITNAKLHKAESKKYDYTSMTRKYEFTGIYTLQSGLGQDGSSVAVYTLDKKGLIAPLNASTEVGAQRWYLTVSNLNGSDMSQASKSRSIKIDEVGEGATTAIEGIQVITNNEADNTSLNGIYDLQGRKLSKEPTHGIYIKNGKKYVK